MTPTKKTPLHKHIAIALFFIVVGIACGHGIATFMHKKASAFNVSKAPEVHFSPEHAKAESKEKSIAHTIVEEINNAKSSIYIAMFSFTHKDIAEALVAANQRNVNIHIMIHKTRPTNTKIPTLAKKIQEIYLGPKGGTFHHKYAVFDEKSVITGSANWSSSGNSKNRDHIIYIEDKQVAQQYIENWKHCQQRKGVVRYGEQLI